MSLISKTVLTIRGKEQNERKVSRRKEIVTMSDYINNTIERSTNNYAVEQWNLKSTLSDNRLLNDRLTNNTNANWNKCHRYLQRGLASWFKFINNDANVEFNAVI